MDNLFKNNQYKVIELFINHPNKEFSIRGIARELDLNHATIILYIEDLLKLGIIKKKTQTLYPVYYANQENNKYQFYKKEYIIFELLDSGLIDFLQSQTLSSSIILFGSFAKAISREESDIDIFVESSLVKLDLLKYEKKLKHKINLLFEPNINNLPKELKNNIINGIILYGFIRI